jgi:hypothetical protein
MPEPLPLVDADSPHLLAVWSDALQSTGDSLGEYLALSLKSTQEIDSGRFLSNRNRRLQLLEAHASSWLMGGSLDGVRRWSFGVPRAFAFEPGCNVSTLASAPLGQFIDALDFGFAFPLNQEALDLAREFPRMRAIRFAKATLVDFESLATHVLWETLKHLDICVDRLQVWPLRAPGLTTLRVRSPARFEALQLPQSLEHLALHFPSLPTEALMPQLLKMPRLKTLSLQCAEGDAWLDTVVSLQAQNRLAALRIDSNYAEPSLEQMLRHAARLQSLKRIELYGRSISKTLRKIASKQLPQLVVLKQAPPRQPWSGEDTF